MILGIWGVGMKSNRTAVLVTVILNFLISWK